jgi:hypothetical protein
VEQFLEVRNLTGKLSWGHGKASRVPHPTAVILPAASLKGLAVTKADIGSSRRNVLRPMNPTNVTVCQLFHLQLSVNEHILLQIDCKRRGG